MFPETRQCLKTAAPLFSQSGRLKALRRLSVHGGDNCPQARRHFSVGQCLTAKVQPRPKPREKVEIPGLERITYADRMHYVPGLSRPVNPDWKKDYKDPRDFKSPSIHEMPLYKEKPCYVYNQRTNALEGVRQALWLTKSKLIKGLPPQLLSLAENPANQIPDQDERVQNAIKHARFWDTTDGRTSKERYSKTLLLDLIHLCASQQPTHPAFGRRMLAENYSLAASWQRGDDLFQVRGQNGLLNSCMDPLPAVSGKQEVSETADYVLESFHPIAPSIDLQKSHTYQKDMNCTGFRHNYPYPHAHTIYFLEKEARYKLGPGQFRAKMLMFTFGNALARAHSLYGTQPQPLLDVPITVQAVGTNGRVFQFLILQLNTTDLSGDDGIKNQVWLEEEVPLYDFAKVRPLIKKKQVKVPAGLAAYKPETFSKFLAMYLHGAV